jgi:hypothetical protein
MKYLLVAIVLFVSFGQMAFAEEDSTQVPEKPAWIDDSTPREKIFVANIRNNSNSEEISDYKLEAALSLACLFSNKYQLIPFGLTDSVAKQLKDQNIAPTAQVIADSLQADKIAFITVNRLENMLRVDLSAVDKENLKKKLHGFGYSPIHFMTAGKEEPLYDPSLLRAMQRALISISGEDSLYAHAKGGFDIVRAAPLVIGGIEFKDDKDEIASWSLFAKQVIYSYDAVETIFESISRNPNYAVYDIASRDSMYAKFGMYTVENYRPVSIHEIDVMNKFEVEYYIGGSFERTSEGATINLFIAEVLPQNVLKVVEEYIGTIETDDIIEFRTELSRITNLLVDQTSKGD